MKIYTLAAVTTLLTSTSLLAQEDTPKHWQAGFGLYSFTISNNISDEEFSGGAISATYAMSDSIAFRGTIFSLEYDEFSQVESSGYDLVIYGGAGLLTQGFKIYGGGGLFKDTWQVPGFEKIFSGFQLGGGLGYNWDAAAIDLVVGIRNVDDYNELADTVDSKIDTAVSGNLSVSFRF